MNSKHKKFITTVWNFYIAHGRHDLPWRKTQNPYRILVSEIMLQQTQVQRVVPKYRAFLKQFPTARRLAEAPLREVLVVWQGLGYNRRAKMLWNCAREISLERGGHWPQTVAELQQLPGVGPYTAAAIMNFAYDLATPMIETNIRTVFLHHFFRNVDAVTDTALLRLIAVVLDQERPREWGWALMDYGADLKKQVSNPGRQSAHYSVSAPFRGSHREIRGAIIRTLTVSPVLTEGDLFRVLSVFDSGRIKEQLQSLINDGLMIKTHRLYSLPI